jgi:L-arabinokinase
LTLAFYISGHGFGHASRQVEIINAVVREQPEARILLRSTAARWLLERTLRAPFTLDTTPTDTGVVQADSLRLDARATIARAAGFYATFDERVDREAAWLAGHGVSLVVADAPPLASAAARRAGLPSIVVANFTWDWIYEGFAEEVASAPGLLPRIRDAYSQATAAWRLPMHGGFASIPVVEDVPLVARHATHSRATVRAALGLPADRRVALCSFGGFGVDNLRLDALDCLDDWDIVVTGDTTGPSPHPHVHAYPEARVCEEGLRYEDLVAACDAVLTKPGYGIVSECIANDTAIVYTSRGNFAEYPVLVAHMRRWVRNAFIDQASLHAGRWRAALDAAAGAPPPPEHPRTDGATVIARKLAGLA